VSGALIADADGLPAALVWFATERPSLLAYAEVAAAWGFDDQIWRLAWMLGPVLDRGGHWQDSIALHRAGIAAARRLGERVGEVSLHRGIATAYKDVRAFVDAEVHAQEAVRLARELPDRLEEAAANLGAAGVYEAQGRFRDALVHVAAARELFGAAGDHRREGFALAGLAHLYLRLGDHERALDSCEQALAPHRDNAANVRASVLATRGQTLSKLGEYDQAVRTLNEARELFREFQYPIYEAVALNHLGDCHEAQADRWAAAAAWQSALDALTGVDDATALLDEVRAKLRRVDDPHGARTAGLRQK
jgi:tetratricopeptide (TPR) repeat protein